MRSTTRTTIKISKFESTVVRRKVANVPDEKPGETEPDDIGAATCRIGPVLCEHAEPSIGKEIDGEE